MTMRLSELLKRSVVDKLIFHSVELSLYQVSAVVDGAEAYITDDRGKYLRSRSLSELRKLFRDCRAWRTVLRHTSAYDEMIGGPETYGNNMLEVRLGDNNFDEDPFGS